MAAAIDGGGPDSALLLVHQLLTQTLYVLQDLLLKGQRPLLLPIAQVHLHPSASLFPAVIQHTLFAVHAPLLPTL